MAAASQTHVILCADIDKTGDFFHSTFKYEQVVKDIQQPFPHASISITNDVQLILVQKSQCDNGLLKSLRSVAVTRLMAAVDDPNQIRDNALLAGSATIETISDDIGGTYYSFVYSYCIVIANATVLSNSVHTHVEKNSSYSFCFSSLVCLALLCHFLCIHSSLITHLCIHTIIRWVNFTRTR